MNLDLFYQQFSKTEICVLEDLISYEGCTISDTRIKTWIESAICRLNGSKNILILFKKSPDNQDRYSSDLVIDYGIIRTNPDNEDDTKEITKEAAYALSLNLFRYSLGFSSIIASKYKTRTDFKIQFTNNNYFEEVEIGGTENSNHFEEYGKEKIDRIKKHRKIPKGFVNICCFEQENTSSRFISLEEN